MELFQQLLNKVRKGYAEADKRLGGWLPGGGTASPVTKALFPPQPFPGRAKQLERQTGVRARIIDPDKTKSIVSAVAPIVSAGWGGSNYANPILNEVGMYEYQGGKTPKERRIEYHELGHINPKDKNWYSYAGVLGRSLQGISEQLKNPPPLDIAAGLALQYADAAEEDRAERFAARWSKAGNYPAPSISNQGTSDYGNVLRREGKELVSSGIERIANPFGAVSFLSGFVNEQKVKPLQEEFARSLSAYRQASSKTDELTPELMAKSKHLSNLAKRIEALGFKPEY
jgi:hypothetical protein